MNPDLPSIARRRHLVTILLRVGVLAWAIWVVVSSLNYVLEHLDGFMMGGLAAWIYSLLIPVASKLAIGGIVLLAERPLVRWLVPVSTGGENVCPKCGYSLKNLKSPVCPECGMDLRAG
ncbi:MAG TPA: hypothetical protein PKE29_03100 [Phycisphaerales bacterium]|nr:hypothetical protein [Phycisphaerales bacterium]